MKKIESDQYFSTVSRGVPNKLVFYSIKDLLVTKSKTIENQIDC